VVGERCGHYIEVRWIAAEIISQQHIVENLEAKQIASLLWQIFMDAHRFFSTGVDARDNLPQSLLMKTYNEVATENVQVYLNVPYSQLMGQDPGESSDGLQLDRKREGSNLVPGRSDEPQIFRHVPAPIKTILKGARSKYPTVTIAAMMVAHIPPLSYNQVKLGPNGACLDFLCFGACRNAKCDYNTSTRRLRPSKRIEQRLWLQN
jgi:hypothetical protein